MNWYNIINLKIDIYIYSVDNFTFIENLKSFQTNIQEMENICGIFCKQETTAFKMKEFRMKCLIMSIKSSFR